MRLLDLLFGSRCGACLKRARDLSPDPTIGSTKTLCASCHGSVQASLRREAEERAYKEREAKAEESRRKKEEEERRKEEEERRKAPGRQAFAAALEKVKGGQPTQIAYSDQPTAFANRVQYMHAWAADGTMPKMTLIVLDACKPGASRPYLLLRTGERGEYMRFHTEPDLNHLRKYLPGKNWGDVTGAAVCNVALPGNAIASWKEYNQLVAEMSAGMYEVRCVIAIDGRPPPEASS